MKPAPHHQPNPARAAFLRARHVYRTVRYSTPKRVWRAILIPIGLLAIGSVGYPLIEGGEWTLFDGFYMTAITLTTIGYGEIYPLSTAGRLFTVAMAFGGIFVLGYFASEIVRSVVSGEMQEYLGRQRMEENLAQMTGHTIVCGLGRMGRIVCEELERQGQNFVVIDTAQPGREWPFPHGLRLHGNATEDEMLRRAGIDRAKAIITTVGSDADNLYITLSARLLNPKLKIVARAEEEEAEAKLRKVGATKVISPYLAGGHRAVQAVLRPSVLHFMEMATRPEFLDLQIEEVRVEPGTKLAGVSLRESRVGQELGVIVVAVQRPTGDIIYGPSGDVVIEPEAILIALGRRSQLDKLESQARDTVV